MRNVTIKQLRLLRAAAQGGSLAAAAEECHVTPSAVTMQMHQLEALVGLPLIERHGRRLTLTAAGREVFAAAERIETVLADCTAGLAALKTLASGRVTVGVVSTAKYFAPQMLAAFARAHPGVDIELIVGNREDTIAAFQSGRFDVAIMGRPPEGIRVESALIGEAAFYLAARDRQANYSDARGRLRYALVGGKVPCRTWHRAAHRNGDRVK